MLTNVQVLIPEHCSNIKPLLKADLRFIGWWNLRYLLSYWQEEKNTTTEKIERLSNTLCAYDNLHHMSKHWNSNHALNPNELEQYHDTVCHTIKESTIVQAQQAKYIKLLIKIMADAKDKPPFASFRPMGYYMAGQKVRCLIEDEDSFTKATVIDNQDGVVTAKLRCSKKSHQVYEKSPTILHDWEYNYLKKHFRYRKLWTKHSGIDATFF